MPSEPSLKATAENLRSMVDMFARTSVGKLPLTPGSDTTITDVLRFLVPQSEGDVVLEGLGGPIGKGAGVAAKSIAELISIAPLGMIRRAKETDVIRRGREAFFRLQKDPRTKSGSREEARAAITDAVNETTAGNVILKRGERRFPTLGDEAEAFDPNFKTAEDVAGFKGSGAGAVDELIGALGSGNTVDEINRMTKVVENVDPELTAKFGRSPMLDAVLDLPQTDLDELAQAGSDLRREGEFSFVSSLISPETGELRFMDKTRLQQLIELIQTGRFEDDFF